MTPCRLIVDPPLDGAWNMGFDEALLEQAADSGVATLRFYQWQEPTLSLGYFQSYDERDTHAASRQAAVVRRQSGGGALMHDRELTYSLTLPADHPLARQSPQLYDVVHRSLIACLAAEGVGAALHSDRSDPSTAPTSPALTGKVEPDDNDAAEPFLCFARRTSADVVLPGSVAAEPPVKIVGSAQRRRRGAVLQHGSILLDRSPAAPELAGIEQISGVSISPEWIIKNWTASLSSLLDLHLQTLQPVADSALMARAEELRAGKYADSAWTHRR